MADARRADLKDARSNRHELRIRKEERYSRVGKWNGGRFACLWVCFAYRGVYSVSQAFASLECAMCVAFYPVIFNC